MKDDVQSKLDELIKKIENLNQEETSKFVDFLITEVKGCILFAIDTYKYHKEGRDEMVTDNFKKFFDFYQITDEDLEDFD